MSSICRHSALEHLSGSEISEVIRRYYAGESVRALLTEFGISCSPGSLWRHFPPIPTGEACPACGAALVQRFSGRSSGGGAQALVSRCASCRHRESYDCLCEHCCARREKIKQATEKRRRTAIADFCAEQWDYSVREADPAGLTARVALGLLCVVRCGGWISPTTVGALDRDLPRFAPIQIEFYNSIALAVIASQLAAPSPESPLEAFIDDTGGNLSWSMDNVHWQLLMPNPANFVHELELFIAKQVWPSGWTEELLLLWQELAIAECLEFAVVIALRKEFPLPADCALIPLLKNLLVDYSVSQVFELLSASTEDAADFVARGYISSSRAGEFVVGACQRHADRARAEGVVIKGIQRDAMMGRTQVSYLLHDVFLGHGEQGFFRAIPCA